MIEKLKRYYALTKPGIIYGNALTAAAGFFLASKGHPDLLRLLVMLLGLSLVIASACVCNNYLDQDIDRLMERTKNRALVNGTISSTSALLFAASLVITGSLLLSVFTTSLSVLSAEVGFVVYVIPYTLLKRLTVHATLVGSIAGAVPPVVGYLSVTGKLDLATLLLFLIVTFWQMPHFYAIAMYRLDEYKRAKIPVLPLQTSNLKIYWQIYAYIIAFTVATSLLSITNYTHYFFEGVSLLSGLVWLGIGLYRQPRSSYSEWGRLMFHISLFVILIFCLSVSVGARLP